MRTWMRLLPRLLMIFRAFIRAPHVLLKLTQPSIIEPNTKHGECDFQKVDYDFLKVGVSE